jgi:hypothetical protein
LKKGREKARREHGGELNPFHGESKREQREWRG